VALPLPSSLCRRWPTVVPACVACRFTDGSRAAADAKIAASIGAVVKTADFGTYTIDADVLEGPNFSLSGLLGYKVRYMPETTRARAPVAVWSPSLSSPFAAVDVCTGVCCCRCRASSSAVSPR
jgi:hypothetical protein